MKGFHCTTVQIPLSIVKSVSYLQRLAAGICRWHWVSVLAQFSKGSAPADLFSSAEKSKGSPSKDKYLTSYIHKINTWDPQNLHPQSASYIWMRSTSKKYAQHQTVIFVMMTSLCLPWTNQLHKRKFYFKNQACISQEIWKVWRINSPKFKTIVDIKTENK